MAYPSISDYNNSVVDKDCLSDEINERYNLSSVLDNSGFPYRISGGLGVVYKMQDEKTGRFYALKVFTQEQPLRLKAYQKIYDCLRYEQSSYLARFEYFSEGIYVDYEDNDTWLPVVLMEWVEGVTLDKYVRENLANKGKMDVLMYRLARLSQWLISQPFAHGDIKPDNIMVRSSDDNLVLVDYDGMFVPSMRGETMRETGTADWAHPQRVSAVFDAHIDDFSLSVLLLSVRALMLDPSLQPSSPRGSTDRLLLSNADYQNMAESTVLAQLQKLFVDEYFCRLYALFLLANACGTLDGIGGEQFAYNLPQRNSARILFDDLRKYTHSKMSRKTFKVEDVSFDMVYVMPGAFMMGCAPNQETDAFDREKSCHKVTISKPYYIGETQVTQALWQAVMGSNPSDFDGNLQRPVECVSWDDCQTFISKLNALTNQTFALPTEAQWEFAARGGTLSKGYVYAGSNDLDEVAWYKGNSASETHPVKTKKPNELGLYDMSGNVWEWCQDWYANYSGSDAVDPLGPDSGSYRVFRGGGWSSDARSYRSSYRFHYGPVFGDRFLGLRLVLLP